MDSGSDSKASVTNRYVVKICVADMKMCNIYKTTDKIAYNIQYNSICINVLTLVILSLQDIRYFFSSHELFTGSIYDIANQKN